jgi:mono/diheme cytochrome c family protein
MIRRHLLSLLVAGATGLLLPAGTHGQTNRQTGDVPLPTLEDQSLSGRDSFETFCGSCHGAAGRGDGPVASQLRTKPPDLSVLAQRNGGAFPFDRIESFVTGTGRTLAAHGTTEMPVWGATFRAFETDTRVRERIRNLVRHIETLQRASSGTSDPGAVLFRTHCASCHGLDARGTGPVAAQFRSPIPDLTGFATRNGGVFPSERLSRIIDGREVASHGDRNMPVWGDVFRRARDGDAPGAVAARIAALVRYLEAIQQRPAE